MLKSTRPVWFQLPINTRQESRIWQGALCTWPVAWAPYDPLQSQLQHPVHNIYQPPALQLNIQHPLDSSLNYTQLPTPSLWGKFQINTTHQCPALASRTRQEMPEYHSCHRMAPSVHTPFFGCFLSSVTLYTHLMPQFTLCSVQHPAGISSWLYSYIGYLKLSCRLFVTVGMHQNNHRKWAPYCHKDCHSSV